MKLSSQKKSARKIYNYLISSNKRPGCLFQIDLRSGVGGGGGGVGGISRWRRGSYSKTDGKGNDKKDGHAE